MSASSPVAASGRQDTRTDAAIEAEMERVFERPEFDDTPSMLDRLFDWIAGLLDVDIGSGVATSRSSATRRSSSGETARWCATSAATASAAYFMTRQMFCTMANRAPV